MLNVQTTINDREPVEGQSAVERNQCTADNKK